MLSRIVFLVRNFIIVALASVVAVSAAESQPTPVVDVVSGLRLTVEVSAGGLPATIPLQLDGIRLIGPPEYGLTKLRELCPPGTRIVIDTLGERLPTDAFGLAKAWVVCDYAAPVDPASAPPGPATEGHRHRTSLQVELIRSGWAEIEDVQAERRIPVRYIQEARQAAQEAQRRRMGAYSLPGFQPRGDIQQSLRPGQRSPEELPPIKTDVPAATSNGAANGF